MLRIKFFEKFKNDFPFVVVIADKNGLKTAYNFFNKKNESYLNDSSIVEFSDIHPLEQASLYMNERECHEISRHFKSLYESDRPGHVYFDIEALGDKIEVIISFNEYEGLF